MLTTLHWKHVPFFIGLFCFLPSGGAAHSVKRRKQDKLVVRLHTPPTLSTKRAATCLLVGPFVIVALASSLWRDLTVDPLLQLQLQKATQGLDANAAKKLAKSIENLLQEPRDSIPFKAVLLKFVGLMIVGGICAVAYFYLTYRDEIHLDKEGLHYLSYLEKGSSLLMLPCYKQLKHEKRYCSYRDIKEVFIDKGQEGEAKLVLSYEKKKGEEVFLYIPLEAITRDNLHCMTLFLQSKGMNIERAVADI